MRLDLTGTSVLVTGGALGMGRLYAERALREGAAHVDLWDRDAGRLASTAAELAASAPGAHVSTTLVDMGDVSAVVAAAETHLAERGAPHVVINNAGVVRGALFWEHDVDRDVVGTMAINAVGPMVLVRTLLPAMLADGADRRILNVASAAATLANPRMSVYAASKWALLGWSDSLRLELERTGNGHVRVTTFCPSYISTGMFEGAKSPLLTPLMTPEVAVDRAWRAMLAGRAQRLTPWTVGLGKTVRGLLPLAAWDVVADRVFKVYGSMDDFRGRASAPAGRD
ncbi:SDR family NAD(P)-dependent oxidoreductase [Flavimobilis sp. GY10621]|uniref:SDR family NAD(P)-dependent oxidoreductase n=1 Tax=Flavimobilis rhizosphaerae TaxID=2775421 RepID=A0ABR9DTD3_9MICO|nr:SDR family NAD(P)-dependent oxidoreductase [Flavimobilis rhizosphaerae]MBD9700199.1 SDR family NAD(P)-dependent oxidoreductase [Flavimobilis rhizosphaerae]